MKKLLTTLAIVTLAFSTAAQAETFLSSAALDSTIRIGSNSHYGGALSTLTFRGLEHINSPDPGRLLQSAVTFDDLGECLNPTQGGSDPRSAILESSVLRSMYVDNQTIYAAVEMGYWLQPGFSNQKSCGLHPEIITAQNTTITSKVLLQAAYTLGYNGLSNVMTHDTVFNVDEFHAKAAFEFTTIYTPMTFSQGLYFDVTTGATTTAVSRYEQNSPLITYTPDGQYAIGLYSKTVGARYTFSLGIDSSKMSGYFRTTNVKANSVNKFQGQYIFGTLDEVKSTMRNLVDG
jgi:hypothetical protein